MQLTINTKFDIGDIITTAPGSYKHGNCCELGYGLVGKTGKVVSIDINVYRNDLNDLQPIWYQTFYNVALTGSELDGEGDPVDVVKIFERDTAKAG